MGVEEIAAITEAMYQNREQEVYEWMGQNLSRIRDELLRIAEATAEFPEISTGEIRQLAVAMLRKIIVAYQKHQMLEMADCMRYEVVQLMELDREMKDGNL
ncbi:MAG: hypothetical protein ACI4DO_05125 [Roseburia sp.]